ncbi:MAG: hypothetical protein OHK0045_22020 [Raineya sp.]
MSRFFKTRNQQVMQQAWSLVKNLKISISEALKRVWKAIKSSNLTEKAQNLAYFKITFVKKETGEITSRIGSNAKMKDELHLLFFSLSDNGFRQAIIANIISVEPAQVQILA